LYFCRIKKRKKKREKKKEKRKKIMKTKRKEEVVLRWTWAKGKCGTYFLVFFLKHSEREKGVRAPDF